MKNTMRRHKPKTCIGIKSSWLTFVIAGLSATLPNIANGQTAERANEERMSRIFNSRVVAKVGSNNVSNSTTPKNAPGNMISEKQIFWYYFKNQHRAIGTNKEVAFNIDKENDVLTSYLKVVHNIELNRYDEFERRRILAKIKEEIKDGIASLDYNTEYAKRVPVASMSEYNFKYHKFRFELQRNISFLHQFSCFDFLSINLPAVISFIDVQINEEDAERVVKYLKGKDIGRYVAAVKFIRVNPVVIEGKYGHKYVTATESKTVFYLMEWGDGHWSYGDKIGENEWRLYEPYPHPELE